MGLANDTFGAENVQEEPWWTLSPAETIRRLGSDEKLGLASATARARLAASGPNALTETRRDGWPVMLAQQFTSVLIIILLVAAAVAAAMGETVDALSILAIVILNAVLGFFQEWKAEQALTALKAMLRPKARVLRDGELRGALAVDLTPGDVVAVETGDQVPADLRLIRAVNLKADESALTGESGAVGKRIDPSPEAAPLAERRCMAYMGSSIVNGRGYGVVVAVGMATELGRVAALTEGISAESTPLKRQLDGLGRQLGAFALSVSALVAVGGWLSGKNIVDMFLTGVSLAVAVVPEGLPAVVTITLALGVATMTRRNALLRHLQAAETLGAATVICTDKTGTLTKNEMTVVRVWLPAGEIAVTGAGYEPVGGFESDGAPVDLQARSDLIAALQTGLVCNHARLHKDGAGWKALGDSTEAALVVVARKAGLENGSSAAVGELSFSSSRKRMTVIARDDARGVLVAHVKGAPEATLARSACILDGTRVRRLTDEDRARIKAAFVRMAEGGLRILALARKDMDDDAPFDEAAVESDLVFLGVAGIIDPPRAEASQAVATAEAAGVKVIMVSGDAGLTALSVARRIGMKAERFVSGPDLDRMDDDALLQALDGRAVFARVSPEHKLRIVSLLQSHGETVAMTGDGVNDAPALKKSDVGVAMGRRGTDVARGAADMILLDDNFSTIVGAIEEGRRQYANIRKFVTYLLSCHVGELIAIVVSLFVGGPLLLLPTQILWMNLVTDGPPALSLAMEPPEADVMRRKPRDLNERIINAPGLRLILPLGVYMAVMTFSLFYYYGGTVAGDDVALAQTIAFTAIIIVQKFNVLNFRSFTAPVKTLGFFRNPWIWLSITSVIALQVAAVYMPVMQETLHLAPLAARHWFVIFCAALPVFLLPEAIKLAFWRNSSPKK
jgi:P-type Ca2+ transporter type 2C